jgi:uncharacterized protein
LVIVLKAGDEVMTCLNRFIGREKVRSAQFSAIAAFQPAVLGYFYWDTKDYQRIPVSTMRRLREAVPSCNAARSCKY